MHTLALLKKMMGFQPVSAEPKRINKLVDFLADYSRKNGLYTVVEKMGERKILFLATRRTKAPALLLNAHLDVVPAEPELFHMRRRGAWLYGRGVNDCLGNSAVIVHVLAQAGARTDAGALFSTDEEIGGATAAWMIARGYHARRMVVVMDGHRYSIATAQKGILAVRMIAKGRACHSSTPWKGINAIDRLIKAYLKIKNIFPAVRPGREWRPTLSANVIRAGTAFNRVPDAAEMVLDIRYTEKEQPAALLAKLKKLTGLRFEKVTESPVLFCNENHPRLRELQAFMRRQLRRQIKIVRMNGATDARHFARLGVPVAIISTDGAGSHGKSERVRLRSLEQYEAMLKELCVTQFSA